MKWLIGAILCCASLAGADEATTYEKVRDARGHAVYRFKKAFVVEGKKPDAFILLPRSFVGYDDPALELPLSTRIHEATTHEPF